VQAGDTLIDIAKKFGISAEALQEANAILNPELLQIGQELVIPREDHNPEAPPTSTPTPLPFEVTGLGFYETPAGGLWCLGEVENTSGRAMERVQVQVSLYNEEDKVLATESAFVALAIVPQGGKVPFAIPFATPPASFAKYQAIPLSGEAVTYLGNRYLDLTITEQQGESKGHYFTVEGLVQNTGQANAQTVTILVTTYDAHGRVTGFRQADLEDALAIGESSPFQVNLLPFGGTVVTYAVQVQGTRLE
jgi:LysM repeat protein